MKCYVNLEEVERIISSDELAQFLLRHTTDFGTALFILQTVQDKLAEIKEKEEKDNEI